jgi:hypothetical protein
MQVITDVVAAGTAVVFAIVLLALSATQIPKIIDFSNACKEYYVKCDDFFVPVVYLSAVLFLKFCDNVAHSFVES